MRLFCRGCTQPRKLGLLRIHFISVVRTSQLFYFVLCIVILPASSGVLVLCKYTVKRYSLPYGPPKFSKNNINRLPQTDTWTLGNNYLNQLNKKCCRRNMFVNFFNKHHSKYEIVHSPGAETVVSFRGVINDSRQMIKKLFRVRIKLE